MPDFFSVRFCNCFCIVFVFLEPNQKGGISQFFRFFRGPPIGDSGKGSRRFCPICADFGRFSLGFCRPWKTKRRFGSISRRFGPIWRSLQIRQNQRVPFGPTPFGNSRFFRISTLERGFCPRVCKRWFPNGGSSLVRRVNSGSPF